MAKHTHTSFPTPTVVMTDDTAVVRSLNGQVHLLDPAYVQDGTYLREGADLILVKSDGAALRVVGYFDHVNLPTLILPHGGAILPETIQAVLATQGHGVQVAGPSMGVTEAIGQVAQLAGKVLAQGRDGLMRILDEGDEILPGDMLRTSGNSLLFVLFKDGTEFQLGEDARAMLDNYIYDPAGSQGRFDATILRGIFRYKSGALAKLTEGSHTLLKTPAAMIRVRGSEADGEVGSDGATTVVHKSGVFEISDPLGQNVVTLDQPGLATAISFGQGPAPVYQAPANLVSRFQQQLSAQSFQDAKQEQQNKLEQEQEQLQERPPEAEPDPELNQGEPPEGEGDGRGPPEGEGDGREPPEGEGDGREPPEGEGDDRGPPEGEGDDRGPPEGEANDEFFDKLFGNEGDDPFALNGHDPFETGLDDGFDFGGNEFEPPEITQNNPEDDYLPTNQTAVTTLNLGSFAESATAANLTFTLEDLRQLSSYANAEIEFNPQLGFSVVSQDSLGNEVYQYAPNGRFDYLTQGQSVTATVGTFYADGVQGSIVATVIGDDSESSQYYTVNEDNPFSGNLNYYVNPHYGSPIAFETAYSGPGSLTLDAQTGAFIYSPSYAFGENSTPNGDSYLYADQFQVALLYSGSGDPFYTYTTVYMQSDYDPSLNITTLSMDEDGSTAVFLHANEPNVGTHTLLSLYGDAQHGTASLTSFGTLSYSPDPDYFGVEVLTLVMDDGERESYQELIITVNGVNDDPVLSTAATIHVTEDQPYSSGTATATDVDGGTLTFALTTQAAHGSVSLDSMTGDYTYTPAAGYFGSDSFTLEVSDGNGGLDSQSVAVTVAAVNDHPQLTTTTTISTAEDTPYSGSAMASDGEGDTLSFSVIQGSHGAVSLNSSTGDYTYTPAADYYGTDSFTLEVSDGNGGTDSQSVTVTITGVNDSPVFTSGATLSTHEDTPYHGTITATDVENDTLTYMLSSQPSHGALTAFDSGTGSYSYTPTTDYYGTDSFTVEVSDGQGGMQSQTITLTVAAQNDLPTISAAISVLTVSLDSTSSSYAYTVADVDGDTLAVSYTASNGGSVVLSNASGSGTFTYTPAAGFTGTETITLKVDDPTTAADPGTYGATTLTVTVTDATAPYTLALAAMTAGSDYTLLSGAAGDALGYASSYVDDFNKDGFGDLVVGAPNADSAGSAYVLYGSSDGFGSSLDLGTLNGSHGFLLQSPTGSNDELGYAVTGTGDFNHDGYEDVIVGLPGYSSTAAVAVVYGHATSTTGTLNLSDLDGSNGVLILGGSSTAGMMGHVLLGGSDYNQDGVDDLFLGLSEQDTGFVAVVYGMDGGYGTASMTMDNLMQAGQGKILVGEAYGDRFGSALEGDINFNNDNYSDLMVGASGVNSGAGAVYVVYGATDNAMVNTVYMSDLSSATGFTLYGAQAGDGLGSSISYVGDLNDDGYEDVIIGAPGANGGQGAAYVLYGSGNVTGSDLYVTDLDGSNGFVINGMASSGGVGYSVRIAGDVDGDGFEDLIIGAPQSVGVTGNNGGQAYVIYGRSAAESGFGASLNLSDLASSQGFMLKGVDSNDGFGASVSGLLDVNGDGYFDLVVGAPAATASTAGDVGGEAYIIYGKDFRGRMDNSYTAGDDVITAPGADTDIIRLDGGAGNDTITGSANGDLIIGGLGHDTLYAGSGSDTIYAGAGNDIIYLDDVQSSDSDQIWGGAGVDKVVINSAAGVTLDYSNGGDPIELSSVEWLDLENGGTDQLTITAWALRDASSSLGYSMVTGDSGDTISAPSWDGQWYYHTSGVYQDPITGSGVKTFNIYYNLSGSSDTTTNAILAVESDVDQSGLNAINISFRSVGYLESNTGAVLNGATAGDLTGRQTKGIGDINGDGYGDFAISAHAADPNGVSAAGQVYVVYGTSDGFGESFELSSLNGANGFVVEGDTAGLKLGYTISGAGDINADGYADFVIGNNQSGDAGHAYVILGSGTRNSATLNIGSLSSSEGFTISRSSGDSPLSTRGGGDINGDGYSDIVLADSNADIDLNSDMVDESNVGAVYVIYGRANVGDVSLTDLDGSNGFIVTGDAAGAEFGVSATAHGDLNGDFMDDLIIGAGDSLHSAAGQLWTVWGSQSLNTASIGVDTLRDSSRAFQIYNSQGGDQFAHKLAYAGDLNGDGYSDMVIGYAGANSAQGGALIIYGRDAMATNFNGALTVSSALSMGNVVALDGFTSGSYWGDRVRGVGDLNGDGYDDLSIGSRLVNGTGATAILYGGDTTLSLTSNALAAVNGSNGFIVYGNQAGGQFMVDGSALGDVNGDGFDDLIAGANMVDVNGGADTGVAYLFYGQDYSNIGAILGSPISSGTLTGTSGTDAIHGNIQSEIIDGGAGADALYGGGGNDILIYDDLDYYVDGGAGSDAIVVSGAGITIGGATTQTGHGDVHNIEAVDLTGTGDNTLYLDLNQVLDITDSKQTLLVYGNSGDTLYMNDFNSWNLATTGSMTNPTSSGNTINYNLYTNGVAKLLVDQDINFLNSVL
ncbi:putative outer membrane adhesin like protein [Magnetococcus marinus MC-1]|uniref:Putative outer membrane adhesin like protein n=1 Tax=Magnetococcus marinus (strain ATCC BAA-1437 / JCM 17883 / MC-1) TaxID=156889 RepID=A0LDY6_MAGMM|nr:tandem-95 repeat protein [Magnetococcus marinus]ABK46179.1 putative outer membrane adhesin like protein [Magnetococcus marinus MC-1]